MNSQMLKRLARFATFSFVAALVALTTGCPKPPKPSETRCSVQIGPNGQRIIKCEVVYKLQAIQDVQNEVNYYNDVDVQDMSLALQPDPNAAPHSDITVTTDTGYTFTGSFGAVNDAALSSAYAPVDSETAPHAYVPSDPQAVRNFINAATAYGSSTVDVTVVHERPVVSDPNASGTETNHLRADTSGGVEYFTSYNYYLGTPSDGGDGTTCRPGMICPIRPNEY